MSYSATLQRLFVDSIGVVAAGSSGASLNGRSDAMRRRAASRAALDPAGLCVAIRFASVCADEASLVLHAPLDRHDINLLRQAFHISRVIACALCRLSFVRSLCTFRDRRPL